MKIECTVEELKELLSNKEDTLNVAPVAGTTDVIKNILGIEKEITKNN